MATITATEENIMSSSYQTGDVVRYQDIANAPRDYIIIEVTNCTWNPYTLRAVDNYETKKTNLRSHGWKLIAR